MYHSDSWHPVVTARLGSGVRLGVKPLLCHLPSLGLHILIYKTGMMILPPEDCGDNLGVIHVKYLKFHTCSVSGNGCYYCRDYYYYLPPGQ